MSARCRSIWRRLLKRPDRLRERSASHEKTVSGSPVDQAAEVYALSVSSGENQMRAEPVQGMYGKQAKDTSVSACGFQKGSLNIVMDKSDRMFDGGSAFGLINTHQQEQNK